MNRIYEKTKDAAIFQGKLHLDESTNCLTIVFNEYCKLEYFEGSYEKACNEGGLFFPNAEKPLTHWHITDDEEALEILAEFAHSTEVYLEKTGCVFSSSKLKTLTKTDFEKKREKYMAKKSLRIYTANEIIKRDGE